MDLTMEKRTIEAERSVGIARAQIPLRGESAPTGARESAQVLWEDARLCLGEAVAAENGVRVQGHLFCQALYRLNGDSALRGASCRIPIAETLDCAGADAAMRAEAQGQVEHLEAEYAQGRVIFTAAVAVAAFVTEDLQTEVVESAKGTGLETLPQTLTLRRVTAVSAAVADLRDQVDLPAALHARSVLIRRGSVRDLQWEREEDGVRVGGEVAVEALLRCGAEDRPVATVKYALPFQQVVPFPDWAAGEAECAAQIERLDCELTDGEGETVSLSVACGVALRARLCETREAVCLRDAYGTGKTDVRADAVTFSLRGAPKVVEGKLDLEGELLPETGVGSVLAVRCEGCVSEVEGDVVRGVVESTCLYVPSGREQVCGVRGETPFELRMDAPIPADAAVTVTSADADAMSIVSDRLEVRAHLTARCEFFPERSVIAVSDMAEVPAPSRPSSLVIRYASRGDTLWDVARRFRVPAAEVMRVAPASETISQGEPLLVWM